jgi:adenylate cyclase
VASCGVMSVRATLDEFLVRAAAQGEQFVAVVRLFLAGTVLIQFMFMPWVRVHLLAGAYKEWIQVGVLTGTVVFSAVCLTLFRRGYQMPWLPRWSVAIDALLPAVVLLPAAIWARSHYMGITSLPDQGFIFLALITSGFRLSMSAVAISTAISWAGALAILFTDVKNGHNLVADVSDYLIFMILMFGSSILAAAMVQRTRTLVYEGANAAIAEERARLRLGQYVSEEIATAALEVDELTTGGETRNVAVLFADLRGFTAYTSTVTPERLVAELNAYLKVMVDVVRVEGGVVDKYIGDAIMVVFGIPGADGTEADRAIRAARKMHEALKRHNVRREQDGLPAFRQGIGVHFGPVVAGNIGTYDRLQYTVIGDAVNLASRLESATKERGVSTLLSAATIAGCAIPPTDVRPIEAVSLRGREAPMEVFTLA